jgi:GR25 family glycosyltransferase involved in LPS biosynthesis
MSKIQTPIFYINLDRVHERRSFMEASFKKLGLDNNVYRFSAIDAIDQNALNKTNYKCGGWRPRWSLTPTEIAVFESHRSVWKLIVDRKLPHAIITEDDIFISTKLTKTVLDIEVSNASFDVIRLDSCYQIHRYGAAKEINTTYVRPILQTVPSAACYMLSLAGAKKLLYGSNIYSDHVDDYIFAPRKNWTALQVWPAIAVQGMFCESDIMINAQAVISSSERTSIKSEVTAPDNGPIAYRVYKEIKRTYIKLYLKIIGDRKIIKDGGVIGYAPLESDLPTYK